MTPPQPAQAPVEEPPPPRSSDDFEGHAPADDPFAAGSSSAPTGPEISDEDIPF